MILVYSSLLPWWWWWWVEKNLKYEKKAVAAFHHRKKSKHKRKWNKFIRRKKVNTMIQECFKQIKTNWRKSCKNNQKKVAKLLWKLKFKRTKKEMHLLITNHDRQKRKKWESPNMWRHLRIFLFAKL